jgi:ATP-binding cassette subfamily B protein
MANLVQSGVASAERIFELLDAEEQEPETATASLPQRTDGHVEFEGVSFSYDPEQPLIEDLTFSAQPGQTVAIVGPTGAGKTTMVNLLQRVFDPQVGQILVDGTDIGKVTRKSLRRSIATVFQDAGLLNRSISDNIRLGREDATLEQVMEAASAAAAADFIETRDDGYDTRVGERGNKLSGGERQRIAIARAILKDAPILVLDEATSALDVETENRVKAAIDNLRQNRTTFIIAHRLSTVAIADRVLVMEHGRIVEDGTPRDLIAGTGRFAKLHAAWRDSLV